MQIKHCASRAMLAPGWPSGQGSVAPTTCFPLHPSKRDAVQEVWLRALEQKAGVPFQSTLYNQGATWFVGEFC